MLVIDPKDINPLALPSLPLESRCNLPRKSALYFVFDEDDEMLYIGKTVSLVKRWQGHHRLAELKQLGNVRIAWMECDSAIMDSLETTFITHFQPLLNGATQGRRYRELTQNQIQCFITPRKLKLYRGYLSYEAYPGGNRVFNGIYGERYKGFAIQNLKELANIFLRIAWSYHSETVWSWADQWLQFSTEAWEDKRDLKETIEECKEALRFSLVKNVVGVSSTEVQSDRIPDYLSFLATWGS